MGIPGNMQAVRAGAVEEVEAEVLDGELMISSTSFEVDMSGIQADIAMLTTAIDDALTVYGDMLLDQADIDAMDHAEVRRRERAVSAAIREADELRRQLNRDYRLPLDAAKVRYDELMGPVVELHAAYKKRRVHLDDEVKDQKKQAIAALYAAIAPQYALPVGGQLAKLGAHAGGGPSGDAEGWDVVQGDDEGGTSAGGAVGNVVAGTAAGAVGGTVTGAAAGAAGDAGAGVARGAVAGAIAGAAGSRGMGFDSDEAAPLVPFEKIFGMYGGKWLNKGAALDAIELELGGIVAKIAEGERLVAAASLRHATEAWAVYWQTLDVDAALARDRELCAFEERQAAQAQARERARELEQKAASLEAQGGDGQPDGQNSAADELSTLGAASAVPPMQACVEVQGRKPRVMLIDGATDEECRKIAELCKSLGITGVFKGPRFYEAARGLHSGLFPAVRA